MTRRCQVESSQVVFVVPAKNNSQEDIIFGQTEGPLQTLWEESEKEGKAPQFSYFAPTTRYLMKKMGYDFNRKEDLNIGKGRNTPPKSAYVPEGKFDDYYQKTHKGLGYESPPLTWCFRADEELYGYFISSVSELTCWDSGISTGAIFKELMANMTSAFPIEIQGDDHLSLCDDPLSRQLGMQWEYRFEQREPPIDGKVIKVNMGDKFNPKPIFRNDSLSFEEKEDLVSLVREYIDDFACNYEDMLGLDP